jgi:pimeloyl-ACP methyl ester carboxylesterase
MAWREWGAGSPVVLLHGGYGSWAHWLRNIGTLAKCYRVIAPDLPGLGDSASPPHTENLDDVADIVGDGVLQVLESDERFHLAAFSFGAQLSGRIAARLGPRVRSLTLIGAGGLGLARGLRTNLRRVERGMTKQQIAAVQRENVGQLMLHDPKSIDDIAVWLQTRNVAAARFKSILFAPGDRLARALPLVTAPIAGIWGEFDITAAPYLDQRRALLRAFQPEAPFHVVAGAGHWVQYEAAAEFNGILLQILATR